MFSNLKKFLSPLQFSIMRDEAKSNLQQVIDTMPKTYEQEGNKDPVAYLHYFIGNCHWFITEKDMTEEEEQFQAYGFAYLGDPSTAEYGYISIYEIIRTLVHGFMVIELDTTFKPMKMSEVKKKYLNM